MEYNTIIIFFLSYPKAICHPKCMNGDCVSPNQCKCKPGFTGQFCETGQLVVFIILFISKKKFMAQTGKPLHENLLFCDCKALYSQKSFNYLIRFYYFHCFFLRFRNQWMFEFTMWTSLHEHPWRLCMFMQERFSKDLQRDNWWTTQPKMRKYDI